MTLSLEKIKKINTQKLGFFRFKKLNDTSYILTNDIGKYEILTHDEFEKFLSSDLESLPQYGELIKKGFIKNDDYETKMINSFALKNHFIGTGPTLHMIITTLRCNHKCKYCHASVAPMTATEFDMDKKTAKDVVDTIFYTNSQALTIEFQGGESLINYEIVQFIVEYARTKAHHLNKIVTFSLVSNLTLMTEEKLTWLLDNGVDICTSLDGDQMMHNNNRTGYKEGNSFEKVTYWLKRVDAEKQKRGMGKIGALLTVTKETLPRYKEIIDAYVGLDLDGIFLRWLNPYGYAAVANLAYTNEEWVDFYKKSLDYIIEINKKGRFFKENITCVFLMKIFNAKDPAFMDIRSPSGIAVGGVAYNYDGKIYASDESRMLGRMGDDSFLLTENTGSGEQNYINMIQSEVTKTAIQSSILDGLPGYNDHVYKPYLGVDIIHNYKTEGSLYCPIQKDMKVGIWIGVLDYIFEKLQDEEIKKIFMGWIKSGD